MIPLLLIILLASKALLDIDLILRWNWGRVNSIKMYIQATFSFFVFIIIYLKKYIRFNPRKRSLYTPRVLAIRVQIIGPKSSKKAAI